MSTNLIRMVTSIAALAAAAVSAVHGREYYGDGRDPLATSFRYAAVDSFLQRALSECRIPGAALVIVVGDEIVYEKGYGAADAAGREVTRQTPFILGSTTKSFTALATMQLVEAGSIELDAPVQRYLPWFRLADPDVSQRITVRQILTHTSGLSEKEGLRRLADPDTSAEALDRYVRDMRTARVSSGEDDRWEYSNANYAILGRIIQEVSGVSFETYLQTNILDPLEMRHTFTSPERAKRAGLATGYRRWFGRPVAAPGVPFVRSVAPAGYLMSCAEDMGHYLSAHLNEGCYKDEVVVSPEGMALLHQPAARMTSDMSYAMGWIEEDRQSGKVLWHNGGTPDFYSYVALFPEQDWGIALLMNTMHIFAVDELDAVAGGAIEILRGRRPSTQTATVARRVASMVYGGAFLLLGAQLLWITVSLVFLRRRLLRPERWPEGRAARARWAGAPLFLNLVLGGLLITALPALSGSPPRVVLLYAPDLASLLLLEAGIALVWGGIKSSLRITALRRARATRHGQSPILPSAHPQPMDLHTRPG